MANEPTGRRCEKCNGTVEQNMKRTREGHATCYPNRPVIREDR